MYGKLLAIFILLLIALLMIGSIYVSYFVIFKLQPDANQASYELFKIFVGSGYLSICISGFLSTWVIILAVLRYARSKRHAHNAQSKESSQ